MYLVPLGELNLKPELLRLLDKKKNKINQQPNNLQSHFKEGKKNETLAPDALCVIVHEVLTTFKEEKKTTTLKPGRGTPKKQPNEKLGLQPLPLKFTM